VHKNLEFFHVGADQVSLADSFSAVAKSTRPTALVGQANTSKSAKSIALVGSADSPATSPVNSSEKLSNRPNVTSSDVGADLDDWRTLLLRYLCDPSAKVDKSVRQSAFKYVLHNNELYRRTAEDLLLKCLGSDQARVVIGEVHEDICGHLWYALIGPEDEMVIA
jgi:hypothetical protein